MDMTRDQTFMNAGFNSGAGWAGDKFLEQKEILRGSTEAEVRDTICKD